MMGVAPIEFQFSEDMPKSITPPRRRINPQRMEVAEKEFNRLRDYFYEPSTSPISSPLVIADKATYPFIRFCGDYVLINKWLIRCHFPIPDVRHQLDRIQQYKLFCDIDLTNGFHNCPLAPATRRMLSVQTPWGQFQPKFLPEGVSMAPQYFQHLMEECFNDLGDWIIVIWDNILILANTYEEAYDKMKIFLARARKCNVILKLKKTWLGFQEVTFFGYLCKHRSYSMTEERKLKIENMPFPTTRKMAQQFLGMSIIFMPFVPGYSAIAADIQDMTRKDFNWDKRTWDKDYVASFKRMCVALRESVSIFYPNYEWKWVVRTDASDYAVGAVILQFDPDHKVWQPIAFLSKKLSDVAFRWSIIEKEAYAIYYAVYTLSLIHI